MPLSHAEMNGLTRDLGLSKESAQLHGSHLDKNNLLASGIKYFWPTLHADDQHYTQNEWPSRETLQPGSHNVVADPLVEPHQILLPPLHTKLGLMKNFVKVINKESPAFAFIKQTFPSFPSGQ